MNLIAHQQILYARKRKWERTHRKHVCVQNLYFIYFTQISYRININRKSSPFFLSSPSCSWAKETLWNFIPAGQFGYYLARRICCVYQTPFCERERAKEITCLTAIDIWSTAAATFPGGSRYVFSESACTIERTLAQRELLFARRYLSFCGYVCLPFDLIISFV